MEKFIIFTIILFAFSYLIYQKIATHKRKKCSDCVATSCSACPLATMPTLKTHLETRKAPLSE